MVFPGAQGRKKFTLRPKAAESRNVGLGPFPLFAAAAFLAAAADKSTGSILTTKQLWFVVLLLMLHTKK